ncbi:MAG: hypothetical protein WBQ50_19325 [Nocardioides sp.]
MRVVSKHLAGPVAAGLLLGAGWGVLARVWMRLISTQPEFTWTGTSMIVGFAALAGGLLGGVEVARRSGRGQGWRLLAIPGLVLFAGAGLVLLPALVLGGWAWGSRRVAALRALAVLVPLAVPVWLWTSAMSEADRLLISPWAFFVGIYALSAALAAAGSLWFARWPRPVSRTTTEVVGVA